ncbi:MAG: antibiotic biosynthesis monooxygenase [Methylobacteriaceae bacterium]|nr:antibiotic biosynthesis monooxygenase [Methylobacteriaceae bacterium]
MTATIRENATFTQVVRFEVAPEKQEALIAAIVAEVERWVRFRPGFVSSTFHASLDGRHVLNYAQWESEEAFRGFTRDPEGERLSAAIKAAGPEAGPDGTAFRVVRSIAGTSR